MNSSWQPSSPIKNLKTRAEILQKIRRFFLERNVLEVDTPCLSHAPVTDPHLVNFETQWASPSEVQEQALYLQTSPEYAMKRLLCAGSGCIYQLSKAFRNEEAGRYHNAEFTMLEWYRLGFDHWQLMDEVEALLKTILDCPDIKRVSYQALFIEHLALDPLTATLDTLKHMCNQLGFGNIAETESCSDTLLQLLFCEKIETQLDKNTPYFVYHFPASQAALAKLNAQDSRVANRFELYYQGIELANGFHELSDAKEQHQRFAKDNQLRADMGLNPARIDQRFLDALHAGLPECAGVALGIDRLIMLAVGAKHIDEVIAFPTPIA